jgi:hypothetical protein
MSTDHSGGHQDAEVIPLHAGSGDLDPLERIAHRFVSGVDDESIGKSSRRSMNPQLRSLPKGPAGGRRRSRTLPMHGNSTPPPQCAPYRGCVLA